MLLRRYHDVPKKQAPKKATQQAPKQEPVETVKRHIPLDPKKITTEDIQEMNYLRLKALAKDLNVEIRGKDREMLRRDILEVFPGGD